MPSVHDVPAIEGKSNLASKVPCKVKTLRPLNDEDVGQIINFVDTHISEKISVESLAEVVGMSCHHFSRCFKLTTGRSPYAFVVARRMELARKLLTETKLSCELVAEQVGFSNMEHFRSQFRRRHGENPSKLRQAVETA